MKNDQKTLPAGVNPSKAGVDTGVGVGVGVDSRGSESESESESESPGNSSTPQSWLYLYLGISFRWTIRQMQLILSCLYVNEVYLCKCSNMLLF